MSKTKPQTKPLPPDVRERLWARAIDVFGQVISQMIKWLVVGFLGYCAMEAIRSLAGKETFATIIFDWVGKLSVNQWLAWLLAGGSCLWACRERRLRQRKVATLADQKRALEEVIDPSRTSSRLPPSGTTRKEDAL